MQLGENIAALSPTEERIADTEKTIRRWIEAGSVNRGL
jgi:hypothetical protein